MSIEVEQAIAYTLLAVCIGGIIGAMVMYFLMAPREFHPAVPVKPPIPDPPPVPNFVPEDWVSR